MAKKDPLEIPDPRATPAGGTPRRRGLPWRVFVAIVSAVLLIMAAIGWIVGSRHPEPPPATATTELPSTPAEPEPAKTPPPIVTVTVDSVPAEETYPLADWNLEKASGGNLDGVTFAGTMLGADMAHLLADSDTIALAGWAGDSGLGVRFAHVVFSMCDRVVGGAAVDIPREDVARAIHPNLKTSGWTASLLIGHLPRCDGATLSVWAVAPFGRILFPLTGKMPLALAPAHGIDPGLVVTTTQPIRPEDADAPTDRILLEIKSARANLRRCSDASCATVGALPRGKHPAIRLDANPEWTLVVVPGHPSGWVSDKTAQISPAR